jgi:hypothetical protein
MIDIIKLQDSKCYQLIRHVCYYELIGTYKNGNIKVKVRTFSGKKGKYIITTNGQLIRC